MKGTVAAIIPAAGRGARFRGRTRKPFVPIAGRPLLAYTLRTLQHSAAIRWIQLVVQPEERARVQALLRRERITKALPPCAGGASRAESVAKGLAALPREASWVLVHDAARPCVSQALIQRCVRAAKRHGAVACGVPATVTVKAADDAGDVRLTLDREHLWFVQTPQVFRRDWFETALAHADHRLSEFPDDASLVEASGFHVRLIPGDPLNLKVTTRDDLVLAAVILKRQKVKGKRKNYKAKFKSV